MAKPTKLLLPQLAETTRDFIRKAVSINEMPEGNPLENSSKWMALRKRWPRKEALLLHYDRAASQRYWDLSRRAEPFPSPVEIHDAWIEYASTMGRLFLEWLSVDSQRCDHDFVQMVNAEMNTNSSAMRGYWKHAMPPKTSIARKRDYEQWLKEASVRASECITERLFELVERANLTRKATRKRPRSQRLARPESIRRKFCELPAEDYVGQLEANDIKTSDSWQNSGCPASYVKAFQEPHWRELIHKEKNRVRRRKKTRLSLKQ